MLLRRARPSYRNGRLLHECAEAYLEGVIVEVAHATDVCCLANGGPTVILTGKQKNLPDGGNGWMRVSTRYGNQRILPVEPAIFLLFGLFHLHRVWAFVDRAGYASFWLTLMESRGPLYYLLYLLLAGLCCVGVVVFVRQRGDGARWRWLYMAGGGYLLFDLAAIQLRWPVWIRLLQAMFDQHNPWWPVIWGGFCLLGAASLAWGAVLAFRYQSNQRNLGRRLGRGRIFYQEQARRERDDG